jgi:hypothetical protein
MHDLVRIFAGELAGAELTETERATALRRLLRYYLVTSYDARQWLVSTANDHDKMPLYEEIQRPPMDSAQEAADWLDLEWPNLVAVAEAGASADDQEDLVRLGRIVSDFSSGSRGLTGSLVWAAGFHMSDV